MFFNNLTTIDVRNTLAFLNRSSYSATQAEELSPIITEIKAVLPEEQEGELIRELDLSLEQINFILGSYERANLVGAEARTLLALVDKLTESYQNKARAEQPLIDIIPKENMGDSENPEVEAQAVPV